MANTSAKHSSDSPSAVPHASTVDFIDESSDEDSTLTPHKPNGNAEASSSKRRLVQETNGGTSKKRPFRGEASEDERRLRRDQADRLFGARQELPFYRGVPKAVRSEEHTSELQSR
ncbi:MAG: hypothetical protein TREMPRED_005222, partial [Tremellales sp. Tagirdzhanova-0007]